MFMYTYRNIYLCVREIPSLPPSLSFSHTEISLGAPVLFLDSDKGSQMLFCDLIWMGLKTTHSQNSLPSSSKREHGLGTWHMADVSNSPLDGYTKC